MRYVGILLVRVRYSGPPQEVQPLGYVLGGLLYWGSNGGGWLACLAISSNRDAVRFLFRFVLLFLVGNIETSAHSSFLSGIVTDSNSVGKSAGKGTEFRNVRFRTITSRNDRFPHRRESVLPVPYRRGSARPNMSAEWCCRS